MNCSNKEFFEKYGLKCKVVIENNKKKIKCPSDKSKIQKKCSKCLYYPLVKCHKNYYIMPCMYPCGKNTGLYHMCPSVKNESANKCYKIVKYFEFKN